MDIVMDMGGRRGGRYGLKVEGMVYTLKWRGGGDGGYYYTVFVYLIMWQEVIVIDSDLPAFTPHFMLR